MCVKCIKRIRLLKVTLLCRLAGVTGKRIASHGYLFAPFRCRLIRFKTRLLEYRLPAVASRVCLSTSISIVCYIVHQSDVRKHKRTLQSYAKMCVTHRCHCHTDETDRPIFTPKHFPAVLSGMWALLALMMTVVSNKIHSNRRLMLNAIATSPGRE